MQVAVPSKCCNVSGFRTFGRTLGWLEEAVEIPMPMLSMQLSQVEQNKVVCQSFFVDLNMETHTAPDECVLFWHSEAVMGLELRIAAGEELKQMLVMQPGCRHLLLAHTQTLLGRCPAQI